MNRKFISTEVLVIASVEIGFGIFEGIILPNFIDQKLDRNWKFRMPPTTTILKITAVLFVTGMISGFLSNDIIQYYNTKMPAAS